MIPAENSTVVTEFALAGITDDPQLQIPLFLVFTLIYLLTLVGNLGVITLILLDSRLHTPMYVFLSHLSLVDFAYSTAVTPKVMAGFLVGDEAISYKACVAQFFFFAVFLIMESFLLASMAYDRHAAVCKPLHYTNIMTARVCSWMVVGAYVLRFLEASVHTWNIFSLSFCRSRVIDHFFCDATPVLALSCSDSNRTQPHSSQLISMENTTEVTEFVLAGLSDDPEVQILLLTTFSLIYLLTLVGNLGMTEPILLDSRLHTPMCFFLSQLSLVDFGYSSAVTPKVTAGLLTGDKTISYEACAAQFFVAFITAESFLSAAMAYDRRAAVCKALHCATAVPTRACARVLTGCRPCGLLTASVHTGDALRLSFCGASVANASFETLLPCGLARAQTATPVRGLFSLRLRSSQGRQEAFSTCAAHLPAVAVFYGTGIFAYLQPSSSHSLGSDRVASVFHATVIPMLNPLVHSLRSKEVKSAFKTAVGKAKSSMGSVF
ncbi:hypothetical protein AB1E18_010880 [Capra hircus]